MPLQEKRASMVPFVWGTGTAKIQFYRSTGTEKYSFTIVQGQRNTVLHFYRGEKI